MMNKWGRRMDVRIQPLLPLLPLFHFMEKYVMVERNLRSQFNMQQFLSNAVLTIVLLDVSVYTFHIRALVSLPQRQNISTSVDMHIAHTRTHTHGFCMLHFSGFSTIHNVDTIHNCIVTIVSNFTAHLSLFNDSS